MYSRASRLAVSRALVSARISTRRWRCWGSINRTASEIGRQIIERLEDLYGPIVVCEGRLWRFDKTHWAPLDDDHIVRFVHRADGAQYMGADGKSQVVRLNRNRVASMSHLRCSWSRRKGVMSALEMGGR
jgi:hypothetical protein